MSNRVRKERVAVVYGGDSTEYEISIKSGKNVAKDINRELFDVYEVLLRGEDWSVQLLEGRSVKIDKNDFSFTMPAEFSTSGVSEKILFSVALIVIHGTPGEDGRLQGYFEMLSIPFTSCSSMVSAITFDKYACKCVLRDIGVKLAKDLFLRKEDYYFGKRCDSIEDEVVERLGLPVFVKPNDGGSSFGVTKVKRIEDLIPALNSAFEVGSAVLIEEFISGREMNNGVFEKEDVMVELPVIEIISKNEFFDYEAKYMGASEEVCPANISDSLSKQIVSITHKIYRHLGCRGVVRADYMVKDDEIYFLEINTVPGMTNASLIPQQIRYTGMSMTEFWTVVLLSSLKRGSCGNGFNR